MTAVSNLPLDSDSLIQRVKGPLGEELFIATPLFKALLDDLVVVVNSTSGTVVNNTTNVQQILTSGSSNYSTFRRVAEQLSRENATLFALFGRLNHDIQALSKKLDGVNALCQSNQVR